MAKIIGIDLGTTNSCVSYMMGDKSEVIANAEGNRTTPSIVYIKGDELLVGEMAKRKAVLEPKNVVYEVKRFIGKKYSEIKDDLKNIPYDVKEGSDGGILIVIDKKEYKPEQISAFILKKLKEDAEKFLGEHITQAVITVPAYFNDSQRNATKASGEIAGLKVERIINEPTAASLAYGEGKNKDEKIAVFDLGGGTFDITILEIGSEGTFQVLSTSGDTHLGGTDFDQRIIDYIVDNFKKKEGIDLKSNAMAMQRIKDEAEKAKKQLSGVERTEISIPFITTGEDGLPRNLEDSLTRSQMENITKDLIERCKTPVKQALQDSKLNVSDINEIILVGGSTRMTFVPKLIKEIFDREPKATVNPDESVSQGAAIQGGIIQGDVKDILLLDVTPLSLAVEVEGGLAHVMIPRNTTIPAKKSNIYTTAADNQSAVTINVNQGERQFARDNKQLGMFNLEGIPMMRRGQPQIEVTFDIDANGILKVTAQEKSTGKKQDVTIQGATNLSDEEITKAKAEGEKFAEEDRKRREIVESKNTLEGLLYQIENMMSEQKDKIPEEEKEVINKLIADGKAVKDKADVTKEEIDAEIDRVNKEFQTLFQKYQATPSSEAPNPDQEIENKEGENKEETAAEGEVIDADAK
ncbi:molecular chaperone DnaK [Candidatus Gracilibacteria bacterium]|nr:molecular chaperone DnaK [Candidatus Gracilibacteria bacterium]